MERDRGQLESDLKLQKKKKEREKMLLESHLFSTFPNRLWQLCLDTNAAGLHFICSRSSCGSAAMHVKLVRKQAQHMAFLQIAAELAG